MEILTVQDDRWDELLEQAGHDVYHTRPYLSHAARHEHGEPIALVLGDTRPEWLVPLLVRPLPDTLGTPREWSDATTPYGYGGPLCLRSESECDWSRFSARLHDAARCHNLVTVFLRWHPLLAHPGPEDVPTTVLHGETVYIDLDQTEDALRSAVRSGHRYEIRRLAAAGYEVVWNEWQYYSQFQRLYASTMQRVGAASGYFFSEGYFDDLRSLLGGMLHFGCVLSPAGEVASASLFTETCGIVQYHLSATAEEFQRLAPSKLLLDRARDWARNRSNRSFHLGGGLGGRADALFQFKAGFSKARSEFCTSRLIVDEERHRLLTQRWAEFHADLPPATSFFPRYRQAA